MNEAIIIVQFLMGISYYTEQNSRVWGREQLKESSLKKKKHSETLSPATKF